MSEATDTRARSDSTEIAFRKIFIGGLSFSTDEDKLRKYFKQYGAVHEAVVMKDQSTNRSRGFGFVTFQDISSVDTALANEPHTIDSRKVEAKRAVPRSEINRANGGPPQRSAPSGQHGSHQTGAPQKQGAAHSAPSGTGKSTATPAPVRASAGSGGSAHDSKHSTDAKINMDDYAFNKIFVGGLHYDTRDAEFRAYFEKYGNVISAEVMFNRETHKSRGFGFIVFEVENSAIQVCQVKEHTIDGKVVEVKRAIPRSRLSPGTPTANITASMYASATTKPAPSSKPTPQPATASAAPAPAKTAHGAAPASKSAAPAVVTAQSTETAAASETKPAAPAPSSRTVSSTSYAAALKAGTAHETATPAGVTGGANAHAAGREHPAQHISGAGMTLMYSSGLQQPGMAVQRPTRSYSEPIVKFFEGSSALNGEVVDEALLLSSRNASAGAISNASSRSNSIVQAPLFGQGYSPDNAASGSNAGKSPVTLGNLTWLSSPPSNPLDPSGAEFGLQLPPPSEQKAEAPAAPAVASTLNPYAAHHNGPPGIVNNTGLWFPANQQGGNDAQQHQQQHQQHQQQHQQHQQLHQQQQAFQQAAMQQQYMGGPFGGMMFMPMAGGNPYMGMNPAPGVAPSPDVWAAMVSSHAMHEHMGMPGGQYPGQPFMMPQFPFFSPEAAGAMGFGPGATPQQQMMYYNAQQQMLQMQHMQYQMAAAQAQMQARAQNPSQGSGPQASNQALSQGISAAGSEQQKGLAVSNAPTGPDLAFAGAQQQAAPRTTGAPGLTPPPAPTGTPVVGRTSEHTESDDLFQFHELNLDSPAFDPRGAATWLPGSRR